MSAPEEDEVETSRIAGYVTLGAFALGFLYVLAMAVPRITTLIVWGLGWTGLILGWRKMSVAPNRTPPPPPERGCEEEPQVTAVKDPEHPNRWIVLPERKTRAE